MYAASACLVLVLIVMGVSLINSFDRMRSVQDTLNSLSGDSDNIEARETSGTVTAVTQEQTGSGQDGDGQAPENEEEESGDSPNAQDGQNGDGTDAQSAKASGTQGDDAVGSGSASPEVSEANGGGQALPSGENGSDGVYIVEEGDTLAIISKKMYGDLSHVDAICKMNGIENGNLIYVGQKLLLP